MTGLKIDQKRWDIKGLPHKGWKCHDWWDEGADSSFCCEMCGTEIRYVHLMVHQNPIHPKVKVGCICAGNLEHDYVNPKKREKKLLNKSLRRIRWLTRSWRISAKGNAYLNIARRNIGIYGRRDGKWSWRIGSIFSDQSYPSSDEAKLALFDKLEDIKDKKFFIPPPPS